MRTYVLSLFFQILFVLFGSANATLGELEIKIAVVIYGCVIYGLYFLGIALNIVRGVKYLIDLKDIKGKILAIIYIMVTGLFIWIFLHHFLELGLLIVIFVIGHGFSRWHLCFVLTLIVLPYLDKIIKIREGYLLRRKNFDTDETGAGKESVI